MVSHIISYFIFKVFVQQGTHFVIGAFVMCSEEARLCIKGYSKTRVLLVQNFYVFKDDETLISIQSSHLTPICIKISFFIIEIKWNNILELLATWGYFDLSGDLLLESMTVYVSSESFDNKF